MKKYFQLDDSLGKEALGWVVAANPLGQMIASPLLGLWGYKTGSIRSILQLFINLEASNIYY